MDMFEHLGADAIGKGPISFSRHHIGTCRMGTPARAWSIRSCGCMAGLRDLVTGGAVPPTLTIVALAHRLAERLGRMTREGSAARTEPLII